MSVPELLRNLSILVVLCLWAYGRYQRQLVWSMEPKVRFERAYGTRPSKTAVLVFTGAFNGPAHTERIVKDYWQTVGDVYVIDYSLQRFSIFTTMLAAYNSLVDNDEDESEYDRVIVKGDSLGGLIAMHLARHTWRHNRGLAKKLVLILADTPLYAEHLRIPGGAAVPAKFMWLWKMIAPLVRFIHLGPLFNRLSSFVAKVTFVPAPAEMHEHGMDKDQFERHMAFMLRNRLSLMIEQIAAIAKQRPFRRYDFNDEMQVIYLQCGDGSQPDLHFSYKGTALLDGHGEKQYDKKGNLRIAKRDTVCNNLDAPDKVIMGDAAVKSLRKLFPNLLFRNVGPNTMHVAEVEGWRSWERVSNEAVALIV